MPRTQTNFERLRDAVGEMIAVEAGEKQPAREHIFDGSVLVEIREEGKVVWKLMDETASVQAPPDLRTIRTRLKQSQEGMAQLLGVSLATVRNWDQGRRKPRGPAARLLKLAAANPGALLGLD